MRPERVHLRVTVVGGRVARAQLSAERHLAITSSLKGKALERLLGAAPLLFPLCARAQQFAAVGAVEAGADLEPPAAHRAARRAILAAESLAVHARSLWLEASEDRGEPAMIEAYARVHRAPDQLARALYPGRDEARIGGGHLDIDRAAARAVVAELTEALAVERLPTTVRTHAELRAWVSEAPGVAAWCAQVLLQNGWGAVAPAQGLGVDLDPEDLRRTLERAADFGARPVVDGAPKEVGALARQLGHPLVEDVITHEGPGLLARLVARWVEVSEGPGALERLVDALDAAPPPGNTVPALGDGVAVVETARGPLAHRVVWSEGLVTAWQRVAPTEWTFHPDGAAAAAAVGWPGHEARARAEWMLRLLDPCVPFEVEVGPT